MFVQKGEPAVKRQFQLQILILSWLSTLILQGCLGLNKSEPKALLGAGDLSNPYVISLRANQSFDKALANKGVFCEMTIDQWSHVSQQAKSEVDSLPPAQKLKLEKQAEAAVSMPCDAACFQQFCESSWLKAQKSSPQFP
jgi:hypothetical protein